MSTNSKGLHNQSGNKNQNSTHMGDVQLHITTENMSHRDFHRQWISHIPNINNDPETPDSKSKRDKRNDINAKYNDRRADDWALINYIQ